MNIKKVTPTFHRACNPYLCKGKYMTTSEELLEMLNNGEFDILVIGHNCFNNYRHGIPTDIIEKYPQVKQADLDSTVSPNSRKLGHFSVAKCESENGKKFFILNAYVQYFYGKVNIVCQANNTTWLDRSPVAYDAIFNAFSLIGQKFKNKKVAILGFPGVRIDAAKALIDVAMKDSGNEVTYINFDEKDKKPRINN